MSRRVWVLWQVGGIAGVALVLPHLGPGRTLWELSGGNFLAIASVVSAAGFATAAVAMRWGDRPPSVLDVTYRFGFAASVWLLLLLLAEVTYSKSIVVVGLLLSSGWLVGPIVFAESSVGGALLLVVVGGATTALAIPTGMWSSVVGDTERSTLHQRRLVGTSRYPLRVDYYLGNVRKPQTTGGGVAVITPGQFLIATGGGRIYRVELTDEPDSLFVRELPVRVPVNADSVETADLPGSVIDYLRVTDIVVGDFGGERRLLASHHRWDTEDGCLAIRLSSMRLERPRVRTSEAELAGDWTTLYDTSPCLDVTDSGRRMAAVQSGGRMALLGPRRLLVTVGDHGFDGVNAALSMPQDTASDYGKTLLIRPDGSSRIFTRGHRNSQGLAVDSAGRIWSTEHGPRGGDELNELEEGENYGWPLETYGSPYRGWIWPRSAPEERSFTRPEHAWIPSIGASSLIALSGRGFPRWRNDLLVSSLAGRKLFRLRLDSGDVVYEEPIPMQLRVRDLEQDSRGDIIAWTDEGTIVRIRRASEGSGWTVALRDCGGCHVLGRVDRAKKPIFGPTLEHVVGRDIGAVSGYPYSAALEEADGRWTAKRLDAFLSDPDSMFSGTRMEFSGIADSSARSAIIDFLEEH